MQHLRNLRQFYLKRPWRRETFIKEEKLLSYPRGNSSSGGSFNSQFPFLTCEFLAITYLFHNYEERGVELRRSVSKLMSSRVGRSSEVNQNRKRGMVLPFEPLSITFDDIKYAVNMPQVSATSNDSKVNVSLI